MVNLNVHLYLANEQALVYVFGLRAQGLVTLLAFRIGARMSSSRMWRHRHSRPTTALEATRMHDNLYYEYAPSANCSLINFCNAMARRTWK